MNICSDSSQEHLFRIGPNVHPDGFSINGMDKGSPRSVFATNVAKLISASGMSVPAVAKKAGITPRGLHYILDEDRAPNIETAEAIANVFGFTASHLLRSDFDPEAVKDGVFDRLYQAYAQADDEGRRVMDTAADYISKHKSDGANDPNGPADKKKGSGN